MKIIPASVLNDLKNISGAAGFRVATDRDTSDARGRYKGNSQIVFRPSDTKTTSLIIQRCSDARLPIVPLGGATGLVAGHIARGDQATILLSTERLNSIRKTNAADRELVAESGVVLSNIQTEADKHGLLFPLSLASEGSCTIGGNLSTNAGGIQVLRYGNARDLVLGIEAVMPSGEIMQGLSPLRKNNTGYDIKNLLIGAEGTLGLITAASLKLYPAQQEHYTAFCPVASPEAALSLLSMLQQHFGEFLSAFELISGQGLQFLNTHFPQIPLAIGPQNRWSVLLELSSSSDFELSPKFENMLGKAIEAGIAADALIAQTLQQRQNFWQIRENIPLANAKVGAVLSFDISVPISVIGQFIENATERVQAIHNSLRINCFGHLGDGNLHFNIFPPEAKAASDFSSMQASLKNEIYRLVFELGGAFSAEHGIGRDKVVELQQYGDPTRLSVMRAIKSALDPNDLFNPGAVFNGQPNNLS